MIGNAYTDPPARLFPTCSNIFASRETEKGSYGADISWPLGKYTRPSPLNRKPPAL